MRAIASRRRRDAAVSLVPPAMQALVGTAVAGAAAAEAAVDVAAAQSPRSQVYVAVQRSAWSVSAPALQAQKMEEGRCRCRRRLKSSRMRRAAGKSPWAPARARACWESARARARAERRRAMPRKERWALLLREACRTVRPGSVQVHSRRREVECSVVLASRRLAATSRASGCLAPLEVQSVVRQPRCSAAAVPPLPLASDPE